jgi:hypothetical protein
LFRNFIYIFRELSYPTLVAGDLTALTKFR